MTPNHADRNLLLGMLALQMNFVTRDALLNAMQAWVFDKTKSLDQILHDQGKLTAEQREALRVVLAEHLKSHDNDPHQSLAALGVPGDLCRDLDELKDADIHASLGLVPDPNATRLYTPDSSKESARYQVLRPYARGGLGEVHVALDRELHREVALKEIQQPYAGDPANCTRFVQEAEITGGLEHPGIVPVYGLGVYADGRPYYAMRLVQGETLKDAIKKLHTGKESLTLRLLLTRFVGVCNAVAYAHSRGVLHRDLKPSNIMLGKYGETLVLDWGLAKAVGRELTQSANAGFDEATLFPHSGESSLQTKLGSAIGTPAYMSPEQAAGRLEKLGPASDVYGLGATLYTILVGRAPVEGCDSPTTLKKVQQGEFPWPCQINKSAPPGLDAVCRKAMALKPEDRYVSALALAADIEAWLADEPVSAYPEPWSVRARRWIGRHKTMVAAAAAMVLVAVLALCVGVVLLSAANEREHGLRTHAEDREKVARERGEEVRRQRDLIRTSLYDANMKLAQQEWESGNVAHVAELLDEYLPRGPGDKDLRGWEWHYQDRLRHSELRVFKGHVGDVNCVVFSPDDSQLASGGDDGTLRIWNAVQGQVLHVIQGHRSDILELAYSPDGRRLATAGRDGAVRVWNAADGARVYDFAGNKTDFRCVAFSPDGKQLMAGGGDGKLRIWDALKGGSPKVIQACRGTIEGMAFRPDGKRLALVGADGSIMLWDVAAGSEPRVLSLRAGRMRGVVYNSDGSRLASSADDGTVRIWDANTGTELRVLRGHSAGVISVVFSPDGTLLASSGFDGTVRLWDALSAAELHVYRGHTGEINGLAFSHDGTRLASAGDDETVRVWDAAGRGGLRVLTGHSAGLACVTFAPDGLQLVSGDSYRTLRIWDIVTGRELRLIKSLTGSIRGVAFSPDGTRLAAAVGDGTVRIWDTAKWAEPSILKGHSSRVTAVAYSPDGKRLASGGLDGTVRVWDLAEGGAPQVFKRHTDRVNGVAFGRDGTLLASVGHDGTVRLWDTVRQSQLKVFKGEAHYLSCVAYSPDGSRLAAAGRDGKIRVWNLLEDGEPRLFMGHTGRVDSLVYSPDGKRLASGGRDGTVRIWDPILGVELRVFKGHVSDVDCLAFSKDGRRLASGGSDRTIRIIDGSPWTPQSASEQEAFGLVKGLFARPLLKMEVQERIRAHNGINAEVRRLAVALAATESDDPARFDHAARHVVRYVDAPPSLLHRARDWAQTASRMAPDHGPYLSTLGIAQYRLGQYADALTTLSRSTKLNQSLEVGDLAFSAMAHHQLGHAGAANAALAKLREAAKNRLTTWNDEMLAFLAEAERVVEKKDGR